MNAIRAALLFTILLTVFVSEVARANSGDYSGSVAIGSSYAGTASAPSNGLIVEGNTGIGTATPGSKLDVKGTLRLSGATSGYVGLTAAATAGSTTYTWPSADGSSGQVLSTNGSGSLSWITGGGGSSQWTTTGSDIYYNTGKVGIGTTSPLSALYIDAATGSTNFIRLHDGSSSYGTALGISSTGGDFVISAYNGGAAAEAFRIQRSSGNIGIGTTSPSYLLTVNGTAYASGAAGALSDIRHKKNVKPLHVGLKEIEQLKPVTFEWKIPKDIGMKGRQIGFVAQDVEKILPTVVITEENKEKTKDMKYNELIPIMAKAIQELKADYDELKTAFEIYKKTHP